jgi:hypothetical protein
MSTEEAELLDSIANILADVKVAIEQQTQVLHDDNMIKREILERVSQALQKMQNIKKEQPPKNAIKMEEPPKLEVKQLTLADAERMMGPFGELFTYSEQGEYIILKPRQYLRNDFREILRVVREELKGEYVSAGKDSHFRIKR